MILLLLRMIFNKYVLSVLILFMLLFDYKIISLYHQEFSIFSFSEVPAEAETYGYYEVQLDVFGIHWLEVKIHEGKIYQIPVEETAVDQTMVENPIIPAYGYLIMFVVAWIFPFKWIFKKSKKKKNKDKNKDKIKDKE
ncbi:MAG TPA: hypothetical protein VIK67_00320 [Acholeplasma sp.]